VSGANAIFAKSDAARTEKTDFDVKEALKELPFRAGGYQRQQPPGQAWPLV